MGTLGWRKPWPQRFWAKTVPAPNGCIEWAGQLTRYGYGVVTNVAGRKRTPSHRAAWLIAYGRWPAMALDHVCRNRRCVNVAHLREATPKENAQNGENALKTRCLRGHPLDATNTIVRNGSRNCRACQAIRRREWYEANREAVLERMRSRYADDRPASIQKQRARRAANLDEANRKAREYRAINRDAVNKYQREWRAANLDEANRKLREWRAAKRRSAQH